MNTTVKVYQENKQGKETFAVVTNGDNVAKDVANALFTLGTIQKKWNAKGVRFSGFALTKPIWFFANGVAFSAKTTKSMKCKLRFREELTLNDYTELVKDYIRTINIEREKVAKAKATKA